MEYLEELNNIEVNGDARNIGAPAPASTSSSYKLFGRLSSVHQFMGGGEAADVMLWRRWRVSCGIIVAATVSWILFMQSGLSFLSICSDVLLILVVMLFFSNYADFINSQLDILPELVLSEEMVNKGATSFRVKLNYVLLMAHKITIGKDFKLFFKVVIALWLLSVVGSLVSFFTLAYIGFIFFMTVPALYNKFQDHADRYAGMLHQRFS